MWDRVRAVAAASKVPPSQVVRDALLAYLLAESTCDDTCPPWPYATHESYYAAPNAPVRYRDLDGHGYSAMRAGEPFVAAYKFPDAAVDTGCAKHAEG